MPEDGRPQTDALAATIADAPAPAAAATTAKGLEQTVVAGSEPAPAEGGHAPGSALGRYIVLTRLGAGGMGEVYAAYDPVLDRRIAVKVLRPALDDGSLAASKRMLLAEAQALAKLAHPNVVAIYDVGTFGDEVYLAMEYIDGQTLAAWLKEEPRPWPEIVARFAAAGRGLEAAHAAGLVHRDVKPDNIILGKDGRVRVIDFGIALATEPGQPVTRSSLAGTPAYMAPEQFDGGAIGPHTDQFSFGVSLYEALWQRRPFEGTTMPEIATNVCEGRVIEAPPGDVPSWLRAAVMRALARDPAARHASMAALLAAIQPVRRGRTVAFALAGAAVIAGAIGLGLAARGSPAAAPCTGLDRELAGVWDPPRAQSVAHAIGGEAWPAVQRALDAYAHGWVDHAVAACRATSVTHEQTAAVLERRTACLDTRRRELDAAVTLLASGQVHAADAVRVATGLRSLASCDTLAALGGGRPDAPAAELQAIEDALARTRALRLAGKYKEARAAAADVVARADRVHWAGEAARAAFERADAELFLGDPQTARDSFVEAIRRGYAADDPTSQAEAWIVLVGMEAGPLRQPTEALRWAQLAEAALDRAGDDEELRANLLQNTSIAYDVQGHYDQALELRQQALALYEHALGPENGRVVTERSSIADSYRHLGRLDDAAREGRAALALAERVLGPSHPELVSKLNNLALTYIDLGRIDEGRGLLQRALAIDEQTLGPTHPALASPLLNLARLERRAGRFDSADALTQRAYQIRVAALGASDPKVTAVLETELTDRLDRGLDRDALQLATEVVARLRAGRDALELPVELAHECELQRRAGQLAAARATCAEAISSLGAAPAADRAVKAYAYAARLAADTDPKAGDALIQHAKAALASVAQRQGDDALVAWAGAHLALAAGRRDEAAALARAAREAFLAQGKGTPWFVDDLARIP